MITPILAKKDIADLLQDEDYLLWVGVLIVTLLVAAMFLSWLQRWRKRQLSDSFSADLEQFATYKQMYERGDLTQEEYDRIRRKEATRVSGKIVPKTETPGPIVQETPAQPEPKEPDSPPSQP